MNTFLKLAITALCAFITCKANEMCSCPRKDYLEGLPDYLEYRSAKDFLTSIETLYLKYLPLTVPIPGIQCVTSTLRGTVGLPVIPRWIYYTDATKSYERFPGIWQHLSCCVFRFKVLYTLYSEKISLWNIWMCSLGERKQQKTTGYCNCELYFIISSAETSHQAVYTKEACDLLSTEI
uniref:Putative nymphal salivary protein of the histamine binding family n=1 Tax=Ixodes ricinus TaxID=34613 RepID=A0A090X8U5_IXORI